MATLAVATLPGLHFAGRRRLRRWERLVLEQATNAQNRTKHEILKNMFDQFSNEDALGSF